jgi:DeoR/GlpR family transcriptional regulator of sugar metabolism
MINDGDYLMLDSSTTALFVVKSIIHKKKITLITNSIEILLELSNKPDWTVISTGGTLKEVGLSLVGYQAERMVSGFHVDMAICSSKGIDSDMGVTDSNERDAEIKKAFFKSAKKKILALDSSKFDITSFIKICDVSDLDMVVTEKRPSDIWLERFRNAGTEVRYEIATGDQG